MHKTKIKIITRILFKCNSNDNYLRPWHFLKIRNRFLFETNLSEIDHLSEG